MAASRSAIESYYVGEKSTEGSEGNARSSNIAGNTNAEISATVICFPAGSLNTEIPRYYLGNVISMEIGFLRAIFTQ